MQAVTAVSAEDKPMSPVGEREAKSAAAAGAPLVPGSVLAFSAGATRPHPEAFHVVAGLSDKLARVLSSLGGVSRPMHAPPLVINAYPGRVEPLKEAVLVDTYGRPSSFQAALLLARARDVAVVVASMPLAVGHLLASQLAAGHGVPASAVLLLASWRSSSRGGRPNGTGGPAPRRGWATSSRCSCGLAGASWRRTRSSTSPRPAVRVLAAGQAAVGHPVT